MSEIGVHPGAMAAAAAEEERYGTGYLEERRLVPRLPTPLPQLVTLVLLVAVFYATWWIFQDPRGYLRLYTPFVGYNYTRWFLIMMIWMVYIFNFWPFRRRQLDGWHPLVKGLVFTGIAVVLTVAISELFFEALLGNMAMAYFNPEVSAQLAQVTDFFAEEYAALAALMFAAIASWLSPAWVVAAERAPWEQMPQPAQGATILAVTFGLSLLVYLITMHPHMGILYYPWQEFAAVTPPYWQAFADTVSGNFHVGWIMACTVTVWFVETIWERYPFKAIRHDVLRRITAFVGIIVIAWCFTLFLYFAQELFLGEAIRGTRREAAPDWRWLHVGEMMVFFLIPALALFFYFDNWPKRGAIEYRWLVRTAITAVGGLVLMWIYYNISHLYLGTQKGLSHPQQFPMIPVIWFANIMLIHHWFMDNWPMWRKETVPAGGR